MALAPRTKATKPNLSGVSTTVKWSARTEIGPIDRQKDEDGLEMLATDLIEESDPPFLYFIQQNLAKEEGSKQPDCRLIKVSLLPDEEWDEPLLICALWEGEAKSPKGGAEPVRILGGSNKAQTERFTAFRDRELEGGSKGWTLYRQQRVIPGEIDDGYFD